MADRRHSLSLCAWACNEEVIIGEFVRKTIEDLERVADDYELIVVDDGSTDRTLDRLRVLQVTTPALRVTSHRRNLGYGRCFSTTLAMATKDVVLWNTADMFFDTRELPSFLQHLDAFDLVQGVRTDLDANHLRGKLTTVVNYWLIRMLFRIRMSEFQNVKVFKRSLLERIRLQARSGFVNAEIGIKALYLGARIKEVPMQFHPRKGGEAKGAPVTVLWSTLSDVVSLWFQWVVLRRVPRAPVRYPVATLARRAWGKPGFVKDSCMSAIDLEAEREFVNRIGPEYFSHKAMTIDRKQILMMVKRGIPLCRGPRVLEMSYNDRGWTDALLDRGFDLTVIEGARYNVDYARAKYGSRLNIIETLFEEFDTAERYNSIIMSCIIEHVLDPALVLRRAASWLADDGVIILVVPNRLSLHRRVGLHCGLLKSMDELSAQDLSVGHRRLYTVESLTEEIAQAGLYTPSIEGIFLKPLSSAQMMDWPDTLLNAFDEMAAELRDYSAYLFAACYRRPPAA